MAFKHLISHPQILKSIAESGFLKPMPIQEQVIPKILAGLDLRASAQTGTGKTAAFILPILSRLTISKPGVGPRVLILVPTRELAQQIVVEAKKHSKYLPNIKTICIYGGASYPQQNRELSSPYDILVATPGRLIDHMKRGRIKFNRLEVLVLDEADRMLDMGFIKPVEQIAKSTPKGRQTLMFSATLKGSVINLSKSLLNNPAEVCVSPDQISAKNIKQYLYLADSLEHKMNLLKHLLQDESLDQALVFTATKRQAASLAKQLAQCGFLTSALHGNMNQRQRTRTMVQMRKKAFRILIATDVAARGLDVLTISHVINFDLPDSAEDYVHRIGRTGRAGAAGFALSLVSHKDRAILREIEQFIRQKISIQTIAGLESKNKNLPSSEPYQKSWKYNKRRPKFRGKRTNRRRY